MVKIFIGRNCPLGHADQLLGLALTDLRCFSILRLKILNTKIQYWNGNFNLKVIQCL